MKEGTEVAQRAVTWAARARCVVGGAVLALAGCGGGGDEPVTPPQANALQAEAPGNAIDSTVPPQSLPPVSGAATGPANVNCADPAAMAALLRRLNAWRASGASCGDVAQSPAQSLVWSDALAAAAQRQSVDMAGTDRITHFGSDGSTATQRVSTTGYRYLAMGENVAAGVPQVEQALGLWMDSVPHCTNMAQASYNQVGAACVVSPTGRYGTYWTLVLARSAS